jgi:hypothetical protein
MTRVGSTKLVVVSRLLVIRTNRVAHPGLHSKLYIANVAGSALSSLSAVQNTMKIWTDGSAVLSTTMLKHFACVEECVHCSALMS